ncbi:spermatogenesis-associated serine-rich protein 1-like [Diadema antillarum]|uniref:spermatogenesis-associated serine-rich protein 1-like n=1 Tax=Diadema antillarum TaxID=105358 RepID=UPI003A898985
MALHVTTEIGKPGRKERERRHYGERRGYEEELKRGRRFIDPGHGDQPDWHPHVVKRNVEYTDYGLDWSSRARFIPPPKHYTGEYPEETTLPKLRTYPDKNAMITSSAEWTAYPEGFHIGKKCNFLKTGQLQHLATITSSNEVTHTMMLGKNRKLNSTWERRGEIPAAAGGDKSYQAPEYSTSFHHYGSARPVVNFGGTVKLKADTFVPLQELPAESCEPFRLKERRRKYVAEVDSVIALNDWTPATPLAATSF